MKSSVTIIFSAALLSSCVHSSPRSPSGEILKVTPGFMAVAAGDMTNSSVILWAKFNTPLPSAQKVEVMVSESQNFTVTPLTFSGEIIPAHDSTTKIDASGLKSGTEYYYMFLTKTDAKGEIKSQTGRFRTAPSKTQQSRVRFAFSGDTDGRWRPYPSIKSFPELKLDFFVFLGDTIYETKNKLSPATAEPFANPEQALTDYHRKYRENLEPVPTSSARSLTPLFSSQGNYTLLDNHELGNKQFINGGAPAGVPAGKGVDAKDVANDVNSTGAFINKTPAFQKLIRAYLDYQPIREEILSTPAEPRSDGTQKLFFSQRWGAHAVFINADDRSYRDIRLKKAIGSDDIGPRADNAKRTMLGKTQLEWLKKTLLDANTEKVRWKFVALSSPIDETADDGGKSWAGGYRAEKTEILEFIAKNKIENVIFLSTDDHQNRVNEVTFKATSQLVTRVPNALSIVTGPIGAEGPDTITDHSFQAIEKQADKIVAAQKSAGTDLLGLDPAFPGLKEVFRKGDPQANTRRAPVDFFTSDTFNYTILDISEDGKTLTVETHGIPSYPANTFPGPESVGSPEKIMSFKISRP